MRGIRSIRYSIFALILAVFQNHPVFAQISVQGPAENIRLEARNASVEEILAVLRGRFDLHYRGTDLRRRVTGTFEGSLREILKHVLDGYDYVIGPVGSNMEVIVLRPGTPGQAVAPIPFVHHRSD